MSLSVTRLTFQKPRGFPSPDHSGFGLNTFKSPLFPPFLKGGIGGILNFQKKPVIARNRAIGGEAEESPGIPRNKLRDFFIFKNMLRPPQAVSQ